jgi:ATP-dependent RNA helicase DeaD
MGFEEATHIQKQAIPVAMEGKDIIGQAQTGTGKTAAFGIPMIERFDRGSRDIQGIVITPTRELAVQVAEELNRIGQCKGIRALPIYGGQDFNWQIKGLRNNPQIIVGTPGRLVDHIRRKTIKLDHIKIAVMDEADEMLDMGFKEDIEKILGHVPGTRQTMLFSATITPVVIKLAKKYMKQPVSIGSVSEQTTVPDIAQNYVEVQEGQKFETLCRLLDTQSPDLAIVFGRTKMRVTEITEALSKRGYSVGGLHGDLDQSKRDRVMKQFKDGSIQMLIATDVAARGIDVSGITHIYNFDIPQDPEIYVHRIGRTARAGKSGISITFVTPREVRLLKIIERMVGKRMQRMETPTVEDAVKGQQRIVVDSILQAAEDKDALQYRTLAEMLLNQKDSVTIVSAALKVMIKEPAATPVKITEPKGKKERPYKYSKRPRNY